MTIDQVHEIVRGANPVPDLDVLEPIEMPFLADSATSGAVSAEQTDVEMPEPESPRLRRGLLLGVATAGLVVIVGLALAFATADTTDIFGSDSRLLQLTFDGEQCSYEGPSELSVGEVEIVYHNESSDKAWFDFVRLDEGRTIQEVTADLEDPSGVGPPTWVVTVWAQPAIARHASSVPTTRTIEPGLHVLLCGTWTPYQGHFGSELTVTP